MPKLSLRRLHRDEHGAVILETALMLTILLMLVFGIFDVGRALYTANGLTSAARESARGAAVETAPCTNLATNAKATARGRFKPFGGDTLKDANITITPSSGCPVSGTGSVKVDIAYPFSWISPLPTLMNWGLTKTLHVTAEYKFES